MALGECLLLPEEQNLGLSLGAGNILAVGVFPLQGVNQEVGQVL